jgi:hypothetical protein
MRKCDFCGYPVYGSPVLQRGHIFCREECAEDFEAEEKASTYIKKGIDRLFKSSGGHKETNDPRF